MTTTDPLTTRINQLTREVNNSIANNGKQWSRGQIIEMALRRGYQMGRDDECEEWVVGIKRVDSPATTGEGG